MEGNHTLSEELIFPFSFSYMLIVFMLAGTPELSAFECQYPNHALNFH
jgi:hypothetical protein